MKSQISLGISLRSLHEAALNIGYPKCVKGRFRSDNANVQADLNIRAAHLFEGTFSDVAAQLYQITESPHNSR